MHQISTDILMQLYGLTKSGNFHWFNFILYFLISLNIKFFHFKNSRDLTSYRFIFWKRFFTRTLTQVREQKPCYNLHISFCNGSIHIKKNVSLLNGFSLFNHFFFYFFIFILSNNIFQNFGFVKKHNIITVSLFCERTKWWIENITTT